MGWRERRGRKDAYTNDVHPGIPDDPKRTFWLGGKNDGKSLAEAPDTAHGPIVFKVDTEAAEVEMKARELLKLGDVGKLAIEADQADDVATYKRTQLRIAKRMHDHTWLRERYLPPKPRRWPQYLMACAFVALCLLSIWRELRHNDRPTLPTADVTSAAQNEGARAPSRKGRAR